MTDAISHIQAVYQPLEDRILLTIGTQDEQLYRAWITRRYLRLLIPALQGKHPRTLKPLLSIAAQQLMQSDETDIDLRSSIFEDYEPNEHTNFPLGNAPVLLTKIAFKELKTDHPLIELNPEIGSGFNVPYEVPVLRLLLKALHQALPRTEWNLEMESSLNLPDPLRLH